MGPPPHSRVSATSQGGQGIRSPLCVLTPGSPFPSATGWLHGPAGQLPLSLNFPHLATAPKGPL